MLKNKTSTPPLTKTYEALVRVGESGVNHSHIPSLALPRARTTTVAKPGLNPLDRKCRPEPEAKSILPLTGQTKARTKIPGSQDFSTSALLAFWAG